MAHVTEDDVEDAPKVSRRALEAQKERDAIKAKAFKSTRFAYYIVGRRGAYSKGKLYKPGELIKLPLDKEPSTDWLPATKDGIAVAEAEQVEKLRKAGVLATETEDGEEVDTDPDEVVETADDEPAPTPPAKPAKGKATKPAKGKRAADTDIE